MILFNGFFIFMHVLDQIIGLVREIEFSRSKVAILLREGKAFQFRDKMKYQANKSIQLGYHTVPLMSRYISNITFEFIYILIRCMHSTYDLNFQHIGYCQYKETFITYISNESFVGNFVFTIGLRLINIHLRIAIHQHLSERSAIRLQPQINGQHPAIKFTFHTSIQGR